LVRVVGAGADVVVPDVGVAVLVGRARAEVVDLVAVAVPVVVRVGVLGNGVVLVVLVPVAEPVLVVVELVRIRRLDAGAVAGLVVAREKEEKGGRHGRILSRCSGSCPCRSTCCTAGPGTPRP